MAAAARGSSRGASARGRRATSRGPPVRCLAAAVTADSPLEVRVEQAFADQFGKDAPGVARVLESFRRIQRDDEFVKEWPELGEQRANSYIEGLTAVPFPDVHGKGYEWLAALEKNAGVVQEEFEAVAMAGSERLERSGVSVWAPPARSDAGSYGPNWRTLVLQDRGIWEETNSLLFAKTKQLLLDVKAPSVEAFFARQEAGTGIAPHTDNTNFIQTAHLGLKVPEGDKCWMDAGTQRTYWREGKALVCDTSFIHGTGNESDEDRYVLIVRFWHPELTSLEQNAIQYLFDLLDNPEPAGFKAAKQKLERRLKKSAKTGAKRGGFGKRR